MDKPHRRSKDPTNGSEGTNDKLCSVVCKAKTKENSHIRDDEGSVGDEKPASRSEYNPGAKTEQACSVGAPVGVSQKYDSRDGTREKKTGTNTLRK